MMRIIDLETLGLVCGDYNTQSQHRVDVRVVAYHEDLLPVHAPLL